LWEFNRQYKNANVLITGGAGFIAANLARTLIGLQAKVFLIVKPTSDRWRIKDISNKATILDIDLSDDNSLNKVITEVSPSIVFHLAQTSAYLLKSADDYHRHLSISTGNLINLFNCLLNSNITGFVHACSSMIYRRNKDSYRLSENTPFDPINFRGMIKLNERNICKHFARKHKFPVRLARIFRAYGPWDHSNGLIIKALDTCRTNSQIQLAEKQFKRDYIYIDDLTNAMLAIGINNLEPGAEINLAGSNQYSAPEIIHMLEQVLGMKILKSAQNYPRNTFDFGNIIGDTTKAKELINWEPATPILEGLRKTVTWYKIHYGWKV